MTSDTDKPAQTGTPTELGIIPCAVDGVFDAINAVRTLIPFHSEHRLTGIGTRPGVPPPSVLH
jgi:hypothetical protein